MPMGVQILGEDLNDNRRINRRSEDVNNNGVLDDGEDFNGDDILDRDAGVSCVMLSPDAENLSLIVSPFVPGALEVNFTVRQTRCPRRWRRQRDRWRRESDDFQYFFGGQPNTSPGANRQQRNAP